MKPIFQILIPTLPERCLFLCRLIEVLHPQLVKWSPEVHILTDYGPGSIGVKRQRMMENSTGTYIAFVDDDDLIAPDYVDRILHAIGTSETMPDVVGITVHVKMDGRDWHPSPIFRHSLRYKENIHWQGENRTPHHLCPVRRELALQCRFPDLMWGEDFSFATSLLPLLQTEAWSGDEPIYFYEYRSKK